MEVKNQPEINTENLNASKEAIFSFLESIYLQALTNEQALECEGIISETELLIYEK